MKTGTLRHRLKLYLLHRRGYGIESVGIREDISFGTPGILSTCVYFENRHGRERRICFPGDLDINGNRQKYLGSYPWRSCR